MYIHVHVGNALYIYGTKLKERVYSNIQLLVSLLLSIKNMSQ